MPPSFHPGPDLRLTLVRKRQQFKPGTYDAFFVTYPPVFG